MGLWGFQRRWLVHAWIQPAVCDGHDGEDVCKVPVGVRQKLLGRIGDFAWEFRVMVGWKSLTVLALVLGIRRLDRVVGDRLIDAIYNDRSLHGPITAQLWNALLLRHTSRDERAQAGAFCANQFVLYCKRQTRWPGNETSFLSLPIRKAAWDYCSLD